VPERVTDPLELASLLASNVPPEWRHLNFSATAWLSDPRNIAFRIGPDLSMFEYHGPGVFMGHIWFSSRGRVALERAKAMLDAMFSDYGAKTIRGETPRRETALFVRKLGFKFHGEAERPIGRVKLCELHQYANPLTATPVL
jgi:hypothetical protein